MMPSNASEQLTDFLDRLGREPAVLVQVAGTEGSAPREAGSWMAVFAEALAGTIGGGHLEYDAIRRARAMLQSAGAPGEPDGPVLRLRVGLGPALGQCCGGVVRLEFQRLSPADAEAVGARLRRHLQQGLRPLALFGGGHVGHALVQVLASLPFALTWIDSRDGVFPPSVAGNVVCEHSEPVQSAVRGLVAHSAVLIMSFSHAEDLDILQACLQRQRDRGDLPYIGLIGSKSKWATFRHRLEARGFTADELAAVTCPIGIPGIEGKEPAVIAVSVAAQLLQAAGRV